VEDGYDETPPISLVKGGSGSWINASAAVPKKTLAEIQVGSLMRFQRLLGNQGRRMTYLCFMLTKQAEEANRAGTTSSSSSANASTTGPKPPKMVSSTSAQEMTAQEVPLVVTAVNTAKLLQKEKKAVGVQQQQQVLSPSIGTGVWTGDRCESCVVVCQAPPNNVWQLNRSNSSEISLAEVQQEQQVASTHEATSQLKLMLGLRQQSNTGGSAVIGGPWKNAGTTPKKTLLEIQEEEQRRQAALAAQQQSAGICAGGGWAAMASAKLPPQPSPHVLSRATVSPTASGPAWSTTGASAAQSQVRCPHSSVSLALSFFGICLSPASQLTW